MQVISSIVLKQAYFTTDDVITAAVAVAMATAAAASHTGQNASSNRLSLLVWLNLQTTIYSASKNLLPLIAGIIITANISTEFMNKKFNISLNCIYAELWLQVVTDSASHAMTLLVDRATTERLLSTNSPGVWVGMRTGKGVQRRKMGGGRRWKPVMRWGVEDEGHNTPPDQQ